ncbi:MAG: ATP-binding protein [Pseudomonadota bacterium]|nr:ATP-binding protein [Pseudomonadota bacterium]
MVKRSIEAEFHELLKNKKSILLLGPRQTGKTTLIKSVKSDLYINLSLTTERRRFELNPDQIIQEVEGLNLKRPIVVIDEIQKVPDILDPIQTLIDDRKAIFVLTGSSARKLRRQSEINLLPGRVIALHMDPFSEFEHSQKLDDHLIYGSLPAVSLNSNLKIKNADLRSYVDIYLEEEVRAEAIVRNLPAFYRFLEVAALESGKIVSFNSISQTLGVAHTTIASYFQILVDCLVVERVDPISNSATRKKLTKSSKYLFFDLGVRRMAAGEGAQLGSPRLGELFENLIGLELLRSVRQKSSTHLHFWRDPDGPEVDWVLNSSRKFIPIEVKFGDRLTESDTKHLVTFMKEYNCPYGAFVVCSAPRVLKLNKDVVAVPWNQIRKITDLCE